ncbi:MAG: HyaD/HybD family hydrogenase maturation endopeptidase [Deltaproteobacteria bacterium]|nr:HyaD/HybD family hydrogenase maturation endopeptidase [Deltaproteobacteria bacterium]
MEKAAKKVLILGIGCLLFSDEGFGVRVAQKIQERYRFPDTVSIVDGGVLGLNLLGVISEADHLIVIDVVRNNGQPGDMYRLEGEAIPERVRAKNSLHQVDFLEALTLCQALEKVPEAVILGVEPHDIETLSIDLTPSIQNRIDDTIQSVLAELDRLNVSYRRRNQDVSCDPLENHEYR